MEHEKMASETSDVHAKKQKKLPLVKTMVTTMEEKTMKHNEEGCCQEKPADIKKYLLGVIALFLLILIIQVGSLTKAVQNNGLQGNTAKEVAAAPQDNADAPTPQIVAKDMAALVDDDAVKGDKKAPVTIVEWSDYECPFCARFYQQTFNQIDEKYIKTGKVKFVYRDFPLEFHADAQKAAEAAECAGEQDKYFDMHNKLFEKGVSGGVAGFKQYAKDLSLNTKKFDDCLDSGKMASEVQKDLQDGSAVGIRGTPGFIINGQLVSGAQPFSVFEQAIEAALKQ